MAVAIRRYLRRSAAVESLVEDWQMAEAADGEGEFSSDLEELCHECLDLCDLVRHTWGRLTTALLEGRLRNMDVVGNAIKTSLDKTLRAIGLVLAACENAMSRGAEIDGVDGLRVGIQHMEAMRQQLLTKWPFVDKKLIAESRAAFARGDHQDIEELLHGLNDNCASTN